MSLYLLIDASYMTFYRYYAVISWYRRAYPDDEEINEKIIMDKFEKRFIEGIEELSKTYKVPYDNIFLCCDCPQKKIWRQQIYPDYKKGRKVDHQISKAFIKLFDFIYPILEKKNIKLFKCEQAEADDIVAVITKYLQDQHKIIIIASDQDYLQLLNDNTEIFTLNKKKNNLRDKSLGNSSLDLEVKIIIGDKSDNIQGCFPRFGVKKAIKYINEDKLESLFNKHLGSKEIYDLNRQLIDFNNIPENIKTKILLQLKKVLDKKKSLLKV